MKIVKYLVAFSAATLSLTLLLYPSINSPISDMAPVANSEEGGRPAFLDWQDEIEEDASADASAATVNQEAEVLVTLPEEDAGDSVEDVDAE